MTEESTREGRWRQLMRLLGKVGPLLGLIAVFGLFSLLGPESFSSPGNLETMARQTAIVGTAALGMTLVIIAGGIDLSVGSIIALVTVVIAAALQGGVNPLLAALAGILAGMASGFMNGIVITRLKVVPFIVTLGTLLILRGAAKGFAHQQKIDAPLTWLVDLLAVLPPSQGWQLFPSGVWLMIVLGVIVGIVLHFMRIGKHIIAVGSSEQTARLCGVPVERVKLIVYTASGGFAGVAGLLQFSRLTVGDPTVAMGVELDVIAAVVIGGGSLSGGEGSVLGTFVGALIMTVIRSGCSQMGLPNWVQEIVTGAIIVVAVALDRWRHRKQES
jgi:ribose transport system permease protein